MVAVDNILRVHSHRQFGAHRAGADAIGTDTVFAKLCGLLFGEMITAALDVP